MHSFFAKYGRWRSESREVELGACNRGGRVNRGRERMIERAGCSAAAASSSSSSSSAFGRAEAKPATRHPHRPSVRPLRHKNEIAFHARVATIDTNYRRDEWDRRGSDALARYIPYLPNNSATLSLPRRNFASLANISGERTLRSLRFLRVVLHAAVVVLCVGNLHLATLCTFPFFFHILLLLLLLLLISTAPTMRVYSDSVKMMLSYIIW
ncbi:hypothetical protein Trydic_g5288 [Trypoxylus dichotomus]